MPTLESALTACKNGYLHYATRDERRYDIVKMWNLTSNQSVIMIPMVRLIPFMDIIGWGGFNAIDLPDDSEHWDRLLEADLSSPLMICSDPFDLFDGCHRVMRAWMEGVDELPCHFVDDVMERCTLPIGISWKE